MADGSGFPPVAALPPELAALAARWAVEPETLAKAIAARTPGPVCDPAAAISGFAARWRAAGRPEPAPGRFGWSGREAPLAAPRGRGRP